MYRPCSEVVHVGLEIPDDSGLVCRRDVCTCANSDIMRLEPRRIVSKLNVNTFQAVNYPLVELVRALWHPLGATLGG
jgi:hypothetical protein